MAKFRSGPKNVGMQTKIYFLLEVQATICKCFAYRAPKSMIWDPKMDPKIINCWTNFGTIFGAILGYFGEALELFLFCVEA